MFVAKSEKTTPIVVAEFVVKHGAHDQSSHNPKKGGGGGGGGGGATPSDAKDDESMRNDKVVDTLATEVDEVKIALDEYYDGIEDGDPDDEIIGRISDSLDASTQNMERAMETKDYDRHSALMDTAEGHLREAATVSTYGTGEFQNEFKRTLERLADKAEEYVGDLEDAD